MPVHPHVRGDRSSSLAICCICPGSPPRAWGQVNRRSCERSRSTVHPHVRGDRMLVQFGLNGEDGSPPRAWGQAPTRPPLLLAPRFTPTCVGTGISPPSLWQKNSVHPHVRGDRPRRFARRWGLAGSPPRAWGQAALREQNARGLRFTPTCVGTGPARLCGLPLGAVHPHVRGDRGCRA